VGPPSTMSGMRSPIWSRTAAAWVHSWAPCRFAEVAVMGEGFDKQSSSGATGGVTLNCQARYLGAALGEQEDQ